MVLNRTHRLYTLKWQHGVARAAETSFNAEVALYEITGEPIYNPDTDTWNRETTTWYTGLARVQPIRSGRNIPVEGNATTIQAVLFSIPIAENDIDFRPGIMGQVLDAPLNPSLEAYTFVVQDVVDASNAFERTLMLEVDQEDRNNG